MRAAQNTMSRSRPPVIFRRLVGRTSSLLPLAWLLLLVIFVLSCTIQFISASEHSNELEAVEEIETIVFKDAQGVEHEEYAFREPSRGLPVHVIDMFCASVKLRLYWNNFRDEIKSTQRKGIYLRRMARLARHIFKDIRDADKPFNATMLSVTDEYFAAKLDGQDEKIDKAIASRGDDDEQSGDEKQEEATAHGDDSKPLKSLKSLKDKMRKKISDGKSMLTSGSKSSGSEATSVKEVMEEVESSDTMRELERDGDHDASAKIKQFAKQWGPKVVLAIYTRWRTMWWMMMSCLYTKYYLWDPALDEFIKLKRSLVMWPELQVARMQDLQCKPLMFFKRLMDVCKVLNPLMNIDFGQFNLDKLTRYKSDSS